MISLLKNKCLKSSISVILVLFFTSFYTGVYANAHLSDKEILDLKNEAFALYSTNNKKEALEVIKRIPPDRRSDDVYVIIANILEDTSSRGAAIDNLNKAILINEKSYKAYYNIGCILLKKKSYDLAIDNFKTSIKYNRDFAFSYYNLACCYIAQGDYKRAKRNLVKAVSLKGDEKDFYMNLAYCYKKLGNEKTAQKIIDSLNNMSKT